MKAKAKFTVNPFYEEILQQMTIEGNKAGDTWMASHTEPAYIVHESNIFGQRGKAVGTMLDVCGFAFLEITDKRKSFPRYYISRCDYEAKNKTHTSSIRVIHKYQGRQEMGLSEAIVTAAYNILKKYSVADGIIFKSYID